LLALSRHLPNVARTVPIYGLVRQIAQFLSSIVLVYFRALKVLSALVLLGYTSKRNQSSWPNFSSLSVERPSTDQQMVYVILYLCTLFALAHML